MFRKILITAALFGLISVLLGAFGAHGLQKLVPEKSVTSFNTGVRYQMYHALFLLFLGSGLKVGAKQLKRIFYFVVIGVLLFSGSIYGLVLDEVIGLDFSSIAFLTPMGGLLLIVGWVLLLVEFCRN